MLLLMRRVRPLSGRVLGANTRAISRAARLSTITRMISTSAAVHARSMNGSRGTPGAT